MDVVILTIKQCHEAWMKQSFGLDLWKKNNVMKHMVCCYLTDIINLLEKYVSIISKKFLLTSFWNTTCCCRHMFFCGFGGSYVWPFYWCMLSAFLILWWWDMHYLCPLWVELTPNGDLNLLIMVCDGHDLLCNSWQACSWILYLDPRSQHWSLYPAYGLVQFFFAFVFGWYRLVYIYIYSITSVDYRNCFLMVLRGSLWSS